MKNVSLLTWNQDKVRAAKPIFEEHWIELNLLNPDIEEIQAPTSLEVAKHTAIEMAKKHWTPVIREDHALYIKWILGDSFPWPYTSYFDKRASAQELLDIIYHDDPLWDKPIKEWYFELWACYAKPDWTTLDLVHRVEIEVSKTLRWERWNLDKILMIKWSWKTLAECEPWENSHLFRKNFELIAKKIKDE